MKKSLFLFAILSGLLMSSCNLEKCSCNTFGMNKSVVKEKHTVTVSAEQKVTPQQ